MLNYRIGRTAYPLSAGGGLIGIPPDGTEPGWHWAGMFGLVDTYE